MTASLLMRRTIALLACLCLSFSATTAVWAQATTASNIMLAAVDPSPDIGQQTSGLGFDITAPTISHLPSINKGVAGDVQTVVAEISDNQAVERALLVYRNSSADFFSTVEMSADVTNTTWLATIDTSSDDTVVQYYIVAEDTGGNRVQKGSESNPLTMELQQAEFFSAIAPSNQDNKKVWLGVGLGVLVVTALLVSSGSSNDGGSTGVVNSDPETSCCTITFTVPNVSR